MSAMDLVDPALASYPAAVAGGLARLAEPAVVDAALAAQRDLAPMPTTPSELDAADRLLGQVPHRFGAAGG